MPCAPPVTTDCRQRSALKLPVKRRACAERHLDVATQELDFWLDGVRVTHVRDRADSTASCRGNDLAGEWKAPPRFDSFYTGFEELERWRVGCPKSK